MHRNHLVGILLIIMLAMFVSNLCADKANQQKMEAQFRADTKFEGKIVWSDNDTFKSLQGFFPGMPVSVNYGYNWIIREIGNVFTAIVPYSGLKKEDFFAMEEVGPIFRFPQKLNGRRIEGYGKIEIEMMDNDKLWVRFELLTTVDAALKETVSKEDIYQTYIHETAARELLPKDDTTFELVYIIPAKALDITRHKPTSLQLTWKVKGAYIWFYYDAMTGKLQKQVERWLGQKSS